MRAFAAALYPSHSLPPNARPSIPFPYQNPPFFRQYLTRDIETTIITDLQSPEHPTLLKPNPTLSLRVPSGPRDFDSYRLPTLSLRSVL